MKIFGKGFNFSQDGPGNRLVYHLSGCNMCCPWCSNPEGMEGGAGEEKSVWEIIEECKSCVPMFFSGGGVTFTGGEATLQHNELIQILKELKKQGINTAIETNGTSDKLLELSKYVDYLIMDFTHYDDNALKEHTGVGTAVIKANFIGLCESGRQLHIRIPVINGINSDNSEKFAQFFALYDKGTAVYEILPYHEYGKDKWKTPYKIKNGFISKEVVKSFVDTFEKYGLKIIKT